MSRSLEKNIHNIPIIGKQYHFFDDGKITKSRHFIATITDVIKYEDEDPDIRGLWEEQVVECDWLYASTTDYFVIASIHEYDSEPIYFARTEDGGWFSFDINSYWQSGLLDVDGKIFNENKQYL